MEDLTGTTESPKNHMAVPLLPKLHSEPNFDGYLFTFGLMLIKYTVDEAKWDQHSLNHVINNFGV